VDEPRRTSVIAVRFQPELDFLISVQISSIEFEKLSFHTRTDLQTCSPHIEHVVMKRTSVLG
jgi:hypothetical protein